MTTPIQPLRIGIDVSRDTLELCVEPTSQVTTIDNTSEAITTWLAGLPCVPIALAVEPTNTYHLDLLYAADQAGHTIYLIDGYRLSRYRDSVGQRAKTDANDARLLLRYLCHEQPALRPWSRPPQGYTQVQRLLRRRAQLVKARVALRQSLCVIEELKQASEALFEQIDSLERLILKHLEQHMHTLRWGDDQRRCQAIEGVGALTSIALTTTYHRGAFSGADAFIAFIGMDVRVRDSGRMRGKRKLTKKGDPQLRRLLYMAAMTARRSPTWKPFYERMRSRGFAPIQALVALARKLARVAFSLLKNQTQCQPKLPSKACAAT